MTDLLAVLVESTGHTKKIGKSRNWLILACHRQPRCVCIYWKRSFSISHFALRKPVCFYQRRHESLLTAMGSLDSTRKQCSWQGSQLSWPSRGCRAIALHKKALAQAITDQLSSSFNVGDCTCADEQPPKSTDGNGLLLQAEDGAAKASSLTPSVHCTAVPKFRSCILNPLRHHESGPLGSALPAGVLT